MYEAERYLSLRDPHIAQLIYRVRANDGLTPPVLLAEARPALEALLRAIVRISDQIGQRLGGK